MDCFLSKSTLYIFRGVHPQPNCRSLGLVEVPSETLNASPRKYSFGAFGPLLLVLREERPLLCHLLI